MNRLIRIVIPVLLAVFIVACTGWYLLSYDPNFTRGIILDQARTANRNGHTGISAWLFNLAYSQSGNDHDAIELSNQYRADGNYTKAEVTLSAAIKSRPSFELYRALCGVYVEQNKIKDALVLLADIPDESIRAQIELARPSAPSPSHVPDFYSQYIAVELSSSHGTILYTTDQDYPSIADAPYSSPIQLSAGETIIRAVSVSEDGLVSPLSVLGYTVGGVVEPAIFMDGNIERAVRQQLGVNANQKLYTNDLWGITEFTVPFSATTLEDLRLLPNLTRLTVDHVPYIDSLQVLEALSSLESLDMTGCHFPQEELTVLTKLPKLTELTLADCGLTTISSLRGMTELTLLNLNQNTLRNLEVVSEMEHLQVLYINHNALESLEFLGFLFDLEKLDISFNSVSSLVPLGVCTRLTFLDASDNHIATVNGIASLPLLAELNLNNNQLSDVSGLASCTSLTKLSIAHNSIYDISGLYTLSHLETFDFSQNNISVLPSWTSGSLREIEGSHNSIRDISPLANMNELTYVSMEYNQISDISCLANCFNLVQVNVFGNPVESVAELRDHGIIVNYDPTTIQH